MSRASTNSADSERNTHQTEEAKNKSIFLKYIENRYNLTTAQAEDLIIESGENADSLGVDWLARKYQILWSLCRNAHIIVPKLDELILETIVSAFIWTVLSQSETITRVQLGDIFALSTKILCKERRQLIFDQSLSQSKELIKSISDLVWLFALPLDMFSLEKRTETLNTATSLFQSFEFNFSELANLFSLKPTQLTEENRVQIFIALLSQIKLGKVIKNLGDLKISSLIPLLPDQQFFNDFFDTLMTIIESKSNELITSIRDIYWLLKFSCEHFPNKYHARINNVLLQRFNSPKLTIFVSDIRVFIIHPDRYEDFHDEYRARINTALTNPSELEISVNDIYDLFLLSPEQFSDECRACFLDELLLRITSGELKIFVINIYQLFSLSLTQFPSDYRERIFNAIIESSGLEIFFKNPHTYELFSLSPEQFSNNHRACILGALLQPISSSKSKISVDELDQLFPFPLNQFSPELCSQIFNAFIILIESRESIFIKDVYDLLSFFSFLDRKFIGRENHIPIFAALRTSISSGNLIKSFSELYQLFSCPINGFFIGDYRKFIFDALWPRINFGEIKISFCDMYQLFSLSPEQFSSEFRMPIFNKLLQQINSREIEISFYELNSLFQLPLDQFSEQQRIHVFTALMSGIALGWFIKNEGDLHNFFVFLDKNAIIVNNQHDIDVLLNQIKSPEFKISVEGARRLLSLQDKLPNEFRTSILDKLCEDYIEKIKKATTLNFLQEILKDAFLSSTHVDGISSNNLMRIFDDIENKARELSTPLHSKDEYNSIRFSLKKRLGELSAYQNVNFVEGILSALKSNNRSNFFISHVNYFQLQQKLAEKTETEREQDSKRAAKDALAPQEEEMQSFLSS